MRVGLDIDGVLASFLGGFIKRAAERGLGDRFPKTPSEWTTHYSGDHDAFKRIWDEVTKDHSFWANLDPLVHPDEIGDLTVDGYVTARPCPNEVSVEWLERNGFPKAPVMTVPYGSSKVEALNILGVRLFIDDNVKNFEEINEAGLTCLLWDTPVNTLHDAGDKRIFSFNDVYHLKAA
jgi:hypothetical protein